MILLIGTSATTFVSSPGDGGTKVLPDELPVTVSSNIKPGWSAISSSIRKSLASDERDREFDAWVGVPGLSGDSDKSEQINYVVIHKIFISLISITTNGLYVFSKFICYLKMLSTFNQTDYITQSISFNCMQYTCTHSYT